MKESAQEQVGSSSAVRVERSADTLTVTLARPDVRNAFNAEMVLVLAGVFQQAAKESGLRALVLAAEGNTFCAGADFRWMSSLKTKTLEENLEDARQLFDMYHALYSVPCPTVARVQGSAYGGGAGLVACCDFAVMADDAALSFSEVRIGLIPATISPFVIRKIGEARAREVFLSGVSISAAWALEIGLVSRVVPPTDLDAAVSEWMDALKRGGPLAQQRTKRLVREIADLPLLETRERTARAIAEQRVSPEGQEGMSAFLEKRKPNWSGG